MNITRTKHASVSSPLAARLAFLASALLLGAALLAPRPAHANLFAAANLSGLSLTCPSTLRSGATPSATGAICTATARYDDGSSSTVRQTSEWSSANSDVLSVSSERIFTFTGGGFVETGILASGVVVADTPVPITITYSEGGISKSASATVTVKAQKLTLLGVSCPATVYVGVPATCTTTASFSDGYSKPVNATWSVNLPAAASMDTDCGNSQSGCSTLTPGEVSSNTAVLLTATYSENGISKSTTTRVTITPPPKLTGLTVNCPASLASNAAASNSNSCTLIETYSGTTANATQLASWSSSAPALLSVSQPSPNSAGVPVGGGKLSTTSASVDTPVTISATVSWYGVPQSASTTVTVKAAPLVLTALTANCPASLTGGDSASCSTLASYSNGSSKNVDATWKASNTALATLNGSIVQTRSVNADSEITLTASYSENGVTQTSSRTLLIKAAPVASSGAGSTSGSSNNTSTGNTAGNGAAGSSGGSNGSSTPSTTPNNGNSGSSSSGTASADCIFNWAEKTYPELFYPANAASQNAGNYYYRYYSGSNAYLAASSGQLLEYLGSLSSGNILSLGALTSWAGNAGCS